MESFGDMVARYRTYKDRNLWLNVRKDRDSLAWWKEHGDTVRDRDAVRQYSMQVSALKQVIGERAAKRCRKAIKAA